MNDTGNRHLLILDDDHALGLTLVAMAKNVGFEARATTSANEFYELLDSWSPSHVALDLMMSESDGIEVIFGLAARQCPAAILITSGAGRRILDAAQRVATEHGLHVAGILPKPFSSAKLLALLDKAPADLRPAAPAKPVADALGDRDVSQEELQAALESGQFFLHYQPKISCADGELAGFEALVRWNHPDRGLVMPNRFIPLAERTGLIDPLTDQILKMAVGWMASAFPNSGDLLSVNLSASSLGDIGLVDSIAATCERMALDPSRLILEVTETSAMTDPGATLDLLTRLRLKGFHLSIDDFGVGYSSLVQLARLPFSEIKIDTSFVREAARSEESRKIIKNIIGLGHSLGLRVTAEGVEDREALEFLKYSDCDLAQGYFIGRPMAEDAVTEWLRASP